jgi:phosphate transport system protein
VYDYCNDERTRDDRAVREGEFWITKEDAMSQHIVASFDADLKALSRMIEDMGDRAQRLLEDALSALANEDVGLAQKVIEADQAVDALQHQVEGKAVATIAKRQPLACDLREVVATIRMSTDLERVGDLAKNLAKRAIAISGSTQPKRFAPSFESLSRIVREQLDAALTAYKIREDRTAIGVWRSDATIDNLQSALFRELLTYMMEDARNIGACTHLLFCAKNLERIGDHATNIAETVHYLIAGDMLSLERPRGTSTSSILPSEYSGADDGALT